MSFRPKAGRPEWRNLLIIFAMVCMTGCRYTFGLEASDLKPMIALRSCICADSTAVIEVHKTVPVTEISKADTALVNPAYSLRCNGKEVEATYEMIGKGGMRISSPAFRSGDRIEVTFSADGMETVSAETVIPDEFPEYMLDIRRNSQGYTSMKIGYKDNPDRADYYAVRIWWKGRRVIYDNNGEIVNEFPMETSVKTYGNYDAIQIDPDAYSPQIVSAPGGDHIYFWSDEDEEDNEYEVKFSYSYSYDVEAGTPEDIELKCRFYTLSEELYKTMFADYDSSYNVFAGVGFSSPSFTYSNIRNGLGHFCGYRMSETEWFPLEEEEE